MGSVWSREPCSCHVEGISISRLYFTLLLRGTNTMMMLHWPHFLLLDVTFPRELFSKQPQPFFPSRIKRKRSERERTSTDPSAQTVMSCSIIIPSSFLWAGALHPVSISSLRFCRYIFIYLWCARVCKINTMMNTRRHNPAKESELWEMFSRQHLLSCAPWIFLLSFALAFNHADSPNGCNRLSANIHFCNDDYIHRVRPSAREKREM